jgi:hypothetical protein
MDKGLKQCLLDVFPALRKMDGEHRQVQFDLIENNFDIPYWANIDDINSKLDENGKMNPYYFANMGEGYQVCAAFLVVKFDKVTMRGRRKITFDPQYVTVTQSNAGEGMPFLKCYENTAIATGVYGKNFRGSIFDGWDTPLHPHVSRNEPCLGSFENMLYKESRTNPVAYLTILGKFYRTWNIDSCFWNINRMTPLYSEAGADNNRTVILDAKTYQRVRQTTGTSDMELRHYIPNFLKQGLDLVDCINPIRVLSDMRHSWFDIFSHIALDARDTLIRETNYEDVWKDIFSTLEYLSDDQWQMYRQSIPGNVRRELRVMLNVIRSRYGSDYVLALEERWKEVISTNLSGILERMQIHLVSAGGHSTFDRELLEGSSARRNWLMSNTDLFYFSNDEEMEFFEKPMVMPEPYVNPVDGTALTFTPKDILNKLTKVRLECGTIAINKLNKQKEVIINEIKTLKSNSIEDSILQQQISF